MIGVIATNPEGVQERMSIEQWQTAKDLGYTFVRTYSEPTTSTSTEKTYIKPSIIPAKTQAQTTKKSGCGCGK